MSPALEHVCCAGLPPSALSTLADLRREPDIRVAWVDGRPWVRWEAGSEAVLRRLLPVSGVDLFARREGLWYRPGCHLPTFEVPEAIESGAVPLCRAITPMPVRPSPPGEVAPAPVRLALVRDDRARPATALRCPLSGLRRWAETATTAELSAAAAARAGDEVMLLGRGLPVIAGGVRFWGDGVLVPLGFRADPDLPEPALRRSLRVAEDALLVLEADGVEVVPREAFRMVTRAGLRLALEGRPT
ncbi:MAG: hypothetical protein JOZ63_02585 [Planctomycetaceae bacterium]|nr:hypothetical protein [Planctomycetaceae bacterium]